MRSIAVRPHRDLVREAVAAVRSVLLAVLVAAIALVHPSVASAYDVPAIQGHVTDTAGILSPEDDAAIEQRLTAYRQQTGNEVAVLVVRSLGNETIDDIAYQTFNSWHLGRRGEDNGVLIVLAPNERRVRIETGRGVGGEIPDLLANDIIRRRMNPLLREQRYREAILAGAEGVAAALDPRARKPATPATPPGAGMFGFIAMGVIALLFFMMARRNRGGPGGPRGPRGGGGGGGGGGFFFFPPMGGGGGWGGGGGGGWGGGDGGGFSGGGGESGGGGSSDSY